MLGLFCACLMNVGSATFAAQLQTANLL